MEVLKAGVRQEDLVARYGDEEFALLLPKTNASQAQQLAERLRAAVEAENLELATGETLRFTISLGVAEYLPVGEEWDASDLIDAADRAMFLAKQGGRNRVVVGGR